MRRRADSLSCFLARLTALGAWHVDDTNQSLLFEVRSCPDMNELQLRWQGCPCDELTCARAAAGGHLEVLQWLRERGTPWDAKTLERAAAAAHLAVVDWCKQEGCPERGDDNESGRRWEERRLYS